MGLKTLVAQGFSSNAVASRRDAWIEIKVYENVFYLRLGRIPQGCVD